MKTNLDEALHEKLNDLEIPGVQIVCDPQEAEQLGAFSEDALSESDALESMIDSLEAYHE